MKDFKTALRARLRLLPLLVVVATLAFAVRVGDAVVQVRDWSGSVQAASEPSQADLKKPEVKTPETPPSPAETVDAKAEVDLHAAQRQHRRDRRGFNTREGRGPRHHPIEQVSNRVVATIGATRRRDRGREQSIGCEAEVDVLQFDQAAHKETGAHDERHRRGDLGHHEQRARSHKAR